MGRLGVTAQGGGGIQLVNNVYVTNNTDTEVTTETQNNANGGADVFVTIDNEMASRVARGEGQLFKAIKRTFGSTVSSVSK